MSGTLGRNLALLPSSLPIATATTAAVVDPRAGRARGAPPLSSLPLLGGVRIDVGRNDRGGDGGGNGETGGGRATERTERTPQMGGGKRGLARSVCSPNYALPPVAIRPSLDRTRERYCSCAERPQKAVFVNRCFVIIITPKCETVASKKAESGLNRLQHIRRRSIVLKGK